jgi:hypothetical protein
VSGTESGSWARVQVFFLGYLFWCGLESQENILIQRRYNGVFSLHSRDCDVTLDLI